MYKTHCILFFTLTLTACATGPDNRPDVAIRGYAPGQVMSACPPGTIDQRQDGPLTYCVLPGAPIGQSARAKTMGLTLYDGRVVMVTARVDLTPNMQTMSYVKSIYTAKYGQGVTPYRTPFKHHWFIRNGVLTLDYADSTLTAYDKVLVRHVPQVDTSDL